jgi:hypothetical protein
MKKFLLPIGLILAVFTSIVLVSMDRPRLNIVGDAYEVSSYGGVKGPHVLFDTPKAGHESGFPTWIQHYDTKGTNGEKFPMWAYVKLSQTNDIQTLTVSLKKTLISFGNFGDQQYGGNPLPFYDPSNGGFWDPKHREWLAVTPKEFLAVIWMQDRN